MEKVKNYIQLHLNILLFSLTSVFSKIASVQYNRHGLGSIWLYVFLALMIGNCGIYAIAWQQVIRSFPCPQRMPTRVCTCCGRRSGQW